jgi:hypothetical protein
LDDGRYLLSDAVLGSVWVVADVHPKAKKAIVMESSCISTGFAACGQLFPRDYRYVAVRQRFRQVQLEGIQQRA